MAPSEPDTSVLRMIRSSLVWPAWIWAYRSSRVALPVPSRPAARGGLPLFDHRPGDLLVGHDSQDVAGLRHVCQAENHCRARWPGLRDALAEGVLQRSDLAVRLADDDHVADAQGAGLNQRGGDRAAALVQLGLDDRADRRVAWGSP